MKKEEGLAPVRPNPFSFSDLCVLCTLCEN
jgi:hypothetical protein